MASSPQPSSARSLQVLPTPARVAEALRERVRDQGVGLALGLIDLRSFEDRLLRACGLQPIGTTEARLALAAVAPEAARGTSLARLAADPVFADSFSTLWDTLRRAGIDAAGFDRLARRSASWPEAGLTARRFSALAKVAVAYTAQLDRRRAVDGVGARARLPALVGDPAVLSDARLRALIDGADTLEIEGSGELPVIRARLWEALARRGVRVRVSVPELPAGLGGDLGLGELQTSVEQLRRNLVEEAPSVELVPRVWVTAGRPVARAGLIPFVAESEARGLVDAGLRAGLRVIEAGDERAELRSVCAEIRTLLQSGVAPQRITLAVPRLGLVRHRVLAALDAAELPVEEQRGQPVLDAAPLRLTFALIEAAERDLPREALAAVLESAYVARRDAPALLAALREAGSRDDRGIGHLGRLRAYAAKLARPPLDTPTLTEAERRRARSARYLSLAERWERLFACLRLPSSASLRVHLDAVFRALRALGVPRRCLALPTLGAGSSERRIERGAVAALARDRQALEALEVAGHSLDEAAQVVGVADDRVTLTEFRGHLEAALTGVRERPPGVRGAGLAIRDLGELAGASSDYLFVIHAVEGALPGRGRPLPFLDDEDRRALSRAAGRAVLDAPGGADAAGFALACASVRTRLVISCHHQDHEGREVGRSRYLSSLIAALGEGGALVRREVEVGVIPSLSECSTRGQVLTRLVGGRRGGWSVGGSLDPALDPALRDALAWSRARASDPTRAEVLLSGSSLAAAHARLDFEWTGRREGEGEVRAREQGLVWRSSATALEDYAACPYRFFAARVLRLRPRPSTRDSLTAAEQGSVRHLVIAEVMQALQSEGLTPLQGGDQTGRENQRAREVCTRVLDDWETFERTGPEPLWLLHRDLVARDLSRLLEGERRVAIEAWEPGEFEVGFGLPDPAKPESLEGVPLAIPAGLDSAYAQLGPRRLELVGRVDRVDYRGEGGEREGLVIDYKSGRVGDRLRYDQLGRTQLQLALYATWLATRQPGLNYADAAYVSLRDGERSKAGLLDLSFSSMELDGLLETDPARREVLRARATGDAVLGESENAGESESARDSKSESGETRLAAPARPRRGGAPEVAVGALDLPATGPRNLADNLWALLGGVAQGRFQVRPYDPGRACTFCPYGPVCRVERGDELEQGAP